MPKKLPILLSSLAIAAGGIGLQAPSASASILDPDGQTVWTWEEVAATAADVSAKIVAECPNDLDCQLRILRSYADMGGIYNGVLNFFHSQIFFTSFNPSAGTIKLIYHISQSSFGDLATPEDTLNDLRIVWTDEGSPDIINTYGGVVPVDNLPDWAHLVYNANSTTHGAGWITSGTEFEISAPESNLDLNTSGFISFGAYGDRSNVRGRNKYDSCINSPYYEPGMECHLVFLNSQTRIAYVPYKDGRPAYPNSGYIEPEVPEPISDPDPNPATTEPSTEPSPSDITNDSGPEVVSTSYTTAYPSPKAPDTGAAYPSEVCSREINMPWWIITLILAGNALLIWWFTPNRHHLRRNPQKSPKKS